jgi:hypothetical protein
MSKLKLLLASVLSVALVGPSHAAPTVPSMSQVHGVTLAQWHRGGWGWGRGGWGWGAWPWIGLGVVAGAIIADEAYRPHPGHYYDEGPYDGPYYYPSDYRGDPREICLQNFRTFQWRTGYYTTYSGEKRLCPYLREATLAPDAAPYPHSDARPGADPYGTPQAPQPGTARPPSATLHTAAPPPEAVDPDGDARRLPPSDTGRPPPYSNAAPPPQGAAPYGDAPGDDEEGPSPLGPEGPPPR